MYDWHVGKACEFRWGGRRSRPAALAVSLLAASIALADGAYAQAVAPPAQSAGGVTVAFAQIGQIAQQTSQTVQAAGAQATTVQVQPANVAAPVAVQSPGSSTVVAQGNSAGAGAAAANSSKTTQGAGQTTGDSPASPSGGTVGGPVAPEPASGGPAQANGQAAQTGQKAGAQATTVQAAPINIAIPIMVGSPGGSIVVVQTNAASSGATAGNSSSTAQASGQAATGPAAALPGAAPAATVAGPAGAAGIPAPTGTTWNWIWNWNWTINVTVPSVQLPVFPRWAFPADEARPAAPARAERATPAPGRRARPASPWTPGGPGLPAVAAPVETTNGVSSSIVHRPKSASEPAVKPFVPLPLQLPAPSAGSGSVPAGLVVGALAFLALLLGSLGLLFGRLSLASVPWRHQAYLTPLQRPG